MNKLKGFPIEQSVVSLWVFKSSLKRAFSVRISPELSAELKTIKLACTNGVEVAVEYDAGADLGKDTLMTLTGPIEQWTQMALLMNAPIEDRLVRSTKGLQNNYAYVVTFLNEGKKLFAVKKVSSSLGSKKSTNFLSAMFSNDTLDLSENLIFSLAKYFDFFVLEDEFFILRREQFESVLGFKEHYKKSFVELLADNEFNKRFKNLEVLKNYVSDNAIHLGRMSSIKQKKKYADDIYWQSVLSLNKSEGWGIAMDADSNFVIEEGSVRSLVSILLGHRVKSLCDREISDASGLISLRRK